MRWDDILLCILKKWWYWFLYYPNFITTSHHPPTMWQTDILILNNISTHYVINLLDTLTMNFFNRRWHWHFQLFESWMTWNQLEGLMWVKNDCKMQQMIHLFIMLNWSERLLNGEFFCYLLEREKWNSNDDAKSNWNFHSNCNQKHLINWKFQATKKSFT